MGRARELARGGSGNFNDSLVLDTAADVGDNILLDGTDTSATNAGFNLTLENASSDGSSVVVNANLDDIDGYKNAVADRKIVLPNVSTGDMLTTSSVAETTKVPMFWVTPAAAKTISDATNAVVEYDNVHFDTHSAWDNSNYRYVAPIAGYYWISMGIFFDTTAHVQTLCTASIRYNGDTVNLGSGRVMLRNGTDNNESELGGSAAWIIYFNGTSDYVDGYAYMDADGTRTILGGTGYNQSWLCGYLLRAGVQV